MQSSKNYIVANKGNYLLFYSLLFVRIYELLEIVDIVSKQILSKS